MTDSITIELDRAITFHTLAGDPLAAHGVKLVLTGGGKAAAPAARLVFRVEPAVYDRIVAESLFGLVPELRGEPMVPFARDRELELDAELRPDVAAALIARGGNARDLVDALVTPETPGAFLATTESWRTRSVVQAIEPPAGGPAGALKSGYRTRVADEAEEATTPSMIDVATNAAARAGTPLEDAGDGLYRFDASSEAGTWTMLVWIDEATRICAVYAVAPEPVPAERRAEVAQYLVERNYYLNVGAFEMDLEDGEVRLRTSFDATHATFDEAVFVNLVASNLHLFELHRATLRGLVEGMLTLAQARAADD